MAVPGCYSQLVFTFSIVQHVCTYSNIWKWFIDWAYETSLIVHHLGACACSMTVSFFVNVFTGHCIFLFNLIFSLLSLFFLFLNNRKRKNAHTSCRLLFFFSSILCHSNEVIVIVGQAKKLFSTAIFFSFLHLLYHNC